MSLIRLVSFFLVTLFTSTVFASTHNGYADDKIRPNDVFSSALILEQCIQELDPNNRQLSQNASPIFSVNNANPREVIFLAQSILNKAQQLSLENTRNIGSKNIELSRFDTKPIHVLHIINEATKSINYILNVRSIIVPNKTITSTNKTPTDVYNQLLIISRKLSILSISRVKPKNVLTQIKKSYAIGKQIYGRTYGFEFDENILNTKKITNKTPEDVFYNLLTVMDDLSILAKKHYKLDIISNINIISKRKIYPSDVLDLANLVLSEFHYIARKSALKINNLPVQSTSIEVNPSVVFMKVNDIHSLLHKNQTWAGEVH